MEATINNISVEVPLKDLSLFKEMIVRMGWKLLHSEKASMNHIDSEEKKAIRIITAPWPSDGLSGDEFVEKCVSGRNSNRELIEL